MRRIIFFILIPVLGILLTIYFLTVKDKNRVSMADVPLPEVLVIINNHKIIAEVARSTLEKADGLSGRAALDENRGMLFFYDQADWYQFWMKEMRFPLDMIWIHNGTIVDITEHVPVPDVNVSLSKFPRYSSAVPASIILEVNAGFVEKYGIEIGNNVEIVK